MCGREVSSERQGGSYGGALAATIIGIPGTPMAAATLLDAHPEIVALNRDVTQVVRTEA